jgi:hypothetical protein
LRLPVAGALGLKIEDMPEDAEIVARAEARIGDADDPAAVLSIEAPRSGA